MRTRLLSPFRSLLLTALLLPNMGQAADQDSQKIAATLLDAQRCLLLFSATGDEHFLRPLPRLAERYEKALADQPGANAMTLWNIWLTHQQSVTEAKVYYAAGSPRLQNALQQAAKAVELLPKFIPLTQGDTPPTLADNLRQLALLEAKGANPSAIGGDAQARRETIADLQRRIDAELAARPVTPDNEALRSHWRYLRLTERESGTLLYPFNAQVENLLARLND